MTSDRPYRKALSEAQGIDELQRHAGTQFDPDIVKAFIEVRQLPADPVPAQNNGRTGAYVQDGHSELNGQEAHPMELLQDQI